MAHDRHLIQPLLQDDPGALPPPPQHVEESPLLKIPATRRGLEYAAKTGFALLAGAGIILGIVAIFATAHWLILGGLILGATFYAVKAARDAYRKHQEEKEAIKKLKKAAEDTAERLNLELQKIDALLNLLDQLRSNQAQLAFDKQEQLYAYVYQLNRTLEQVKKFSPDKYAALNAAHPGTIQALTNEEQAFCNHLTQHNPERSNPASPHNDAAENATDAKLPRNNPHYQSTLTKAKNRPLAEFRPTYPAKAKPSSWFSSPWTFLKKSGNRLLSFLGGASVGATVGIGVATFVLGAAALTGPFGWVIGGIIIGAVVAGAIALAIDYAITRSQERKIAETKHQTSKLEHFKDNIMVLTEKANVITEELKNTRVSQEKVQLTQEKVQLSSENQDLKQKQELLVEDHKKLVTSLHESTAAIERELYGKKEALEHLKRDHSALAIQNKKQEDELRRKQEEADKLKNEAENLRRENEERQKALDAQQRLAQEREAERERQIKELQEKLALLQQKPLEPNPEPNHGEI